MTPEQFTAEVADFFDTIVALLENCFADQASVSSRNVGGDTFRAAFKLSIALESARSQTKSGELTAGFQLGLDRTGQHVAIDSSQFSIRLLHSGNPRPIVRYEFDRHPRTTPGAHLHVHSDSVPLALSLERNGRGATGFEQSKIHFPLGGHRFRVCLEDVIQLAVDELGFVARDSWQEHVANGRAKFRQKQAATVIRHHHELAAATLRELGYSVSGKPGEDELPEASVSW